ncbi:hypothetical protein [Streptomyces sp. col6]|uniref:hypothetical protein n=1 Tax=Streptomyces sp. col6 TaxID=2478958 RepID=UPI001CD0AE9D|nr:hypothetical protein [Streptomyces sp. col6]
MVIMSPAIPSEMVKLDPIDVRRPIGRISVVTMAKIPSMTEMTASQETNGVRSGDAGDWTEGVIAVDMNPVPSGASHGERDLQSSRKGHRLLADFRPQQSPPAMRRRQVLRDSKADQTRLSDEVGPCHPPVMEQDQPLVRDVFPGLVAELTALLEAEGEHWLAISAWDVRMAGTCSCTDDFCQSIRTADHPQGEPYGPGHRCVPLIPAEGMLNLDVLDGRIMFIEVLDRAPMRNMSGTGDDTKADE